MGFLAFALNLPYTMLGLFGVMVSVPVRAQISHEPLAIIINAKSFWWYRWLPGKKNVRAMTIGHVILLSPDGLPNDLKHELVHVEQYVRQPLVYPVLYTWQTLRHGYHGNRYEAEAYAKSGSVYLL